MRTDSEAAPSTPETARAGYTQRLQQLGGARWKRILNVQAPYRWNLRRMNLGFTLDLGCGIGRNLHHLDGYGVGVDHNADSIKAAREAGLTAYTPDEFGESTYAKNEHFDSILAAHLLEHLDAETGKQLIADYLPYVRSGGTVMFITPQERGYASDSTHVRFVGFEEATKLAEELELDVVRQLSFPFLRALGKLFTYNEFVVVCQKRLVLVVAAGLIVVPQKTCNQLGFVRTTRSNPHTTMDDPTQVQIFVFSWRITALATRMARNPSALKGYAMLRGTRLSVASQATAEMAKTIKPPTTQGERAA